MIESQNKRHHQKCPTSSIDLLELRRSLPVWSVRQDLVKAVRQNNVVIIVGDTGSGKSTQIPHFLMRAGYSRIAVSQPRRISAISLATRVRDEVADGSKLGATVGYAVRFDDKSCADTKIRFMTDGILLRELAADPLLKRYSVVILDEAHERSVRTDIALGLLRRNVLSARSDFRLVVMSATLDCDRFAKYFAPVYKYHGSDIDAPRRTAMMPPVVRIPGRTHEIRVFYLNEPALDYVDATLRTIVQICNQGTAQGDILAFMNGQDDIEAAASLLREHAAALPPMVVCPLYANLPPHLQQAVFLPAIQAAQVLASSQPQSVSKASNLRKVILATNIAETALTIPGLRYVIDNGLAKFKHHVSRMRLETLKIEPISRAAAAQRAGRAGREAPGFVYRLYTQDAMTTAMAATATPEILRADLAGVVLALKVAGVSDVAAFEFLDPPNISALRNAHARLVSLGALDAQTLAPTKLGHEMSRMPLDPTTARALICAADRGLLSHDLVSLIALMCVDTIIAPTPRDADSLAACERHRAFLSPDGDLLTWLNALRAYENRGNCGSAAAWCRENYLHTRNLAYVINVRNQLREILGPKLAARAADNHTTTAPAPQDDLLRGLLLGYFTNVAFLQPDGRYEVVGSKHIVSIHPSSVLSGLRAPVVSFVELVAGDSERCFLRGVSRVDPVWVKEAASHVLREKRGTST